MGKGNNQRSNKEVKKPKKDKTKKTEAAPSFVPKKSYESAGKKK